MTTRPIPVVDPHVAPEDKPRLQSHSERILAMLMDRPQTNRDLLAVTHRFSGRIEDLRKAGHLIRTEKLGGGLFRYRLVRG